MICWYALQWWRNLKEKQSFYDKLKCELDIHSVSDLVMRFGDFNGHIGRRIDGFDWFLGGYDIGEINLEGRMLLEFCVVNELCVLSTWFRWKEKRKVTFRMGENDKKIDFVLIKKEHRQYVQNVKTIPWWFQHALVVADIDKKKIMNVVKKNVNKSEWYVLREERSVWWKMWWSGNDFKKT